jgi:hypothetical protein
MGYGVAVPVSSSPRYDNFTRQNCASFLAVL